MEADYPTVKEVINQVAKIYQEKQITLWLLVS